LLGGNVRKVIGRKVVNREGRGEGGKKETVAVM